MFWGRHYHNVRLDRARRLQDLRDAPSLARLNTLGTFHPMALWKKLLWIAVTLLGLASLGVLALSRGEQISALWIVIAGFCAAAISYRFYSKWIAAKILVLNDERATPAVVKNDGKDFVPTNRWMVFGHHFAAIAGPGPLVGPVLAAQFGFLLATLWIFIVATLVGAAQDRLVLF